MEDRKQGHALKFKYVLSDMNARDKAAAYQRSWALITWGAQ